MLGVWKDPKGDALGQGAFGVFPDIFLILFGYPAAQNMRECA
jgi:hypothetical protein